MTEKKIQKHTKERKRVTVLDAYTYRTVLEYRYIITGSNLQNIDKTGIGKCKNKIKNKQVTIPVLVLSGKKKLSHWYL
jgi:hypothetical protein